MSFSTIKSALVASYLDGNFSIPTSFDNMPFEKPNSAWASLNIIPNQPNVVTLGKSGEDEHTGIIQISLYYQHNTGDGEILAKASEISRHYQAGKKFAHSGQEVLFITCGRSRGRLDNGWYAIDLTIQWSARTTRNII